MPDTLIAALSGEEVLHSSSLATVATSCVVIRTATARSRTIVSLARISRLETIKTTYPALLAIAAGLFLMAAAAYYSKDGGAAQFPLGALGLFFVVAYFVSRKACVVFWMGYESVQTVNGGLRDAATLIREVRAAQANLPEPLSEEAVAS